MTTNLHDKMLAAIDALFSASDGVEEEAAENLLLDVRDEINKHKLAAESLTEGLRLDDWDKIGCVNHDCDKCRALAEQPAQQEPWAWLFQHEETGLTQCVDTQQVEWGFEKNNPRWQKIAPLYTTPQPPAQPLTDEQKYALIKDHLGLDQRRDDTVVDRSTGRFTDAARYFYLIDAAIEAAHGIIETQTERTK